MESKYLCNPSHKRAFAGIADRGYLMDGLLLLNKAIRNVCGQSPHRSTVVRWSTKGVLDRAGQRVKLQTKRIGGRYYSHPDWVREFIDRISEPPAPSLTVFRSEHKRQRDTASAKAQLDEILG
jgi:hypothetical protein